MERIDLNNKTILVTGGAGFIGSNLIKRLFKDLKGGTIINIDNENDYYDVRLKEYRKEQLEQLKPEGIAYHYVKGDIADKVTIDKLFEDYKPQIVVNLAAQAGVRYSIENPNAYIMSNMMGFYNILEACRHNPVEHLVYASSSSVYGGNKKVPFSTDDRVDNPVSLYAATKKSNELMAHAYCKLYGISMTGLRFFTVYGPWGRPDMSPMLFASAISRGEAIKVFNGGDMIRDFTYIDDIVEGTVRCIDREPAPDNNGLRYRVYNIGCSHPVKLMDFISEIEQAMGCEAKKVFLPMQPGDVYQTNADTSLLEAEVGYKPHVRLHEGIAEFAKWYKSDKNPLK